MNQHQLSQLVQDVIDGNEDPIKAFAVIKEHSDFTAMCLDKIKEYAVEEAKKFDRVFEHEGFRFEQRAGGKYYDFSVIPAWQQKKSELSELEQKYKAAYSNYEKGQSSITEDGEVLEIPLVKNRPDVLILKK